MELKVKISHLIPRAVLAEPDAGTRIQLCVQDAVTLCAVEQRDVEFVFNGKLHRVAYKDLLDQMKTPS